MTALSWVSRFEPDLRFIVLILGLKLKNMNGCASHAQRIFSPYLFKQRVVLISYLLIQLPQQNIVQLIYNRYHVIRV